MSACVMKVNLIGDQLRGPGHLTSYQMIYKRKTITHHLEKTIEKLTYLKKTLIVIP